MTRKRLVAAALLGWAALGLFSCKSGGSSSDGPFCGAASPSPISQKAFIRASNPGPADFFGISVALSADGNTLAVGAIAESSASTGINGNQADDSAVRAGAVYVFIRNGTDWTQQAYVKASNTNAGDEFGRHVALSGDGNTMVVGAAGESSAATGIDGGQADNSVQSAGAVYVFTRGGTSWTQQAYIKASTTSAFDNFGGSVGLSGDGSSLVVGANDGSSPGTGGAVYVFARSGATWAQQAKLKTPNTGTTDGFGFPVALSGDGNTLAVGAANDSSSATGVNGNPAGNGAPFSGAVHVFARNGATWAPQAYVKASNTGTNDGFGFAITLSGDGNTLAVGTEFEDSSSIGIDSQSNDLADAAGAAYVFARSGATWAQQAYIKASNTNVGDGFANSIALSGDGNSLAVGAHNEDSGCADGTQTDNSASNSGAVYVFARAGAAWTQHAYVKASNLNRFDELGSAVALSGDGGTLAAGAKFYTFFGDGAGAAYVFQ